MPDITKGYTFVSGETVTPKKLNDLLDAGTITAGSVTPDKLSTGGPSWTTGGTLSATAFSGPLTGNASTATTLQTARTLALSGDVSGNASFNGGANATIAATIGTGSVTPAKLSTGAPTWTTAGTLSATAFSGPLTGAVTGNASTATTLQTARTLALSGDVSGSVSFNGSANATIAATIANDAVNNAKVAGGSLAADRLDATAQSRMAKAWVNFNGTGTVGAGQTIRSSYNVTSVTKNGTGDYTINFSTAIGNANYAITGSGSYADGGTNNTFLVNPARNSTTPLTSGAARINTLRISDNTLDNPLIVCVQVFGS